MDRPAASAVSSKPLFQRCIDLIATLYSFPLFEFYLFPDGVDAYLIPSLDENSLPTIAEPVEVLWHTFKLGAPLCVIYNELAATTTGAFLEPDDVSYVTPNHYPTMPCKDNLYKFVAACSEANIPQAKEVGGISDLYKDHTGGFMKFLRLVEEIIHRIEMANNMPAQKSLPFSTEIAKEIANPLDNRARLIKELVETERAYIFSLEELQRYENELASSKIFSSEMVYMLFSNLDDLLDFQRRFMVGMESTVNLGVVEQRIGQLFILNEEAFEIYFPFCANYQNACNLVVAHTENLKMLSNFIPPHQLQSFLIKPLQRLVKYPLLLKELLKLTDPATYPYMDELKEACEAIKRVTEKLNELQRRDENERNRVELLERMDDWKGLQIHECGELLLADIFGISSNDIEKEYHLFLFERILLCCKKDSRGSNPAGARVPMQMRRKNSDSVVNNYRYVLRGNIFMSSIDRVQDLSDSTTGSFRIQVSWKESGNPDILNFKLKCRNAEQVALWCDRLTKQVEIFKPVVPDQFAHFSDYSTSPTLVNSYSQLSGYPPSPGTPFYVNSSLTSPIPYGQNSLMRPRMGSGGPQYGSVPPSPISYVPRSGSFDFPPPSQGQYLDNGLVPSPGSRALYDRMRPSNNYQQIPMGGVIDGRGRSNSTAAIGYTVPPMNDHRMPPGRPNTRDPSLKRTNGSSGSVANSTAASTVVGTVVSAGDPMRARGREGLNALASLAASGLPLAGFSDDEGDSGEDGNEDDDEDDDERAFRISPVVGTEGVVLNNGTRRVVETPARSASATTAAVVAAAAAMAAPVVPTRNRSLSNDDTDVTNAAVETTPYPRRPPTAPVTPHLTVTTAQPASSSFIKIRAHYDGDVLIVAMPVRGATLQELRNRIERKVNMMPHKSKLSEPIQLVVKEENDGEWSEVGRFETDEDVVKVFGASGGLLNVFLG
ncbi:hypothetical protein HDU84_005870 [Entophlyctis sp. JEL0112]|nr:hypothetical protein HDU84_005870 [Entophlyctis sp. JEL0112]